MDDFDLLKQELMDLETISVQITVLEKQFSDLQSRARNKSFTLWRWKGEIDKKLASCKEKILAVISKS